MSVDVTVERTTDAVEIPAYRTPLIGRVYEAFIVEDDAALILRVAAWWDEDIMTWRILEAWTMDEDGQRDDRVMPSQKMRDRYGSLIDQKLLRDMEEEAQAAREDDAADYGEAKARWG